MEFSFGELTNIRPTKERITGERSKNGTLSVFGDWKGKAVKVYEPFNQEQLKFRMYIDNHSISKYFPKVLGIGDNLIVEEFIYQNCKVTLKAVQSFHKQLLEVEYDRMTWDYFDFIYKRAGMVRPEVKLPLKVNHNDLTKDNILCVDGQIKVIDNESLAMNDAWQMNTVNSNIMPKGWNEETRKHWKVRTSWKLVKN